MKTNKDLIKTHFPHEFEIQQLYDLQFMQMDSPIKILQSQNLNQ